MSSTRLGRRIGLDCSCSMCLQKKSPTPTRLKERWKSTKIDVSRFQAKVYPGNGGNNVLSDIDLERALSGNAKSRTPNNHSAQYLFSCILIWSFLPLQVEHQWSSLPCTSRTNWNYGSFPKWSLLSEFHFLIPVKECIGHAPLNVKARPNLLTPQGMQDSQGPCRPDIAKTCRIRFPGCKLTRQKFGQHELPAKRPIINQVVFWPVGNGTTAEIASWLFGKQPWSLRKGSLALCQNALFLVEGSALLHSVASPRVLHTLSQSNFASQSLLHGRWGVGGTMGIDTCVSVNSAKDYFSEMLPVYRRCNLSAWPLLAHRDDGLPMLGIQYS